MIVSVSRRTDVPSFYGRWFEERLRQGWAEYANPFDPRRRIRVSLVPQDVSAFVFWSKDFSPFLEVLHRIHGRYAALFNCTVTGYGPDLEPGLPDAERRIEALEQIGRLYGSRTVFWRYDTVVFTHRYTAAWHRENFRRLAGRLAGKVDRCVISFLQVYAKVARNMTGVPYRRPSPEEETAFAQELAEIASREGLAIRSCCQDHLAAGLIRPGACIDGPHLAALYPERFPRAPKAKGTRNQCLCAQSRDIGAYDTCGHGCRYCYAVGDHQAARRRASAGATAADGALGGDAKETVPPATPGAAAQPRPSGKVS